MDPIRKFAAKYAKALVAAVVPAVGVVLSDALTELAALADGAIVAAVTAALVARIPNSDDTSD